MSKPLLISGSGLIFAIIFTKFTTDGITSQQCNTMIIGSVLFSILFGFCYPIITGSSMNIIYGLLLLLGYITYYYISHAIINHFNHSIIIHQISEEDEKKNVTII
jgi:hypothetical protein